MWSLSSIIFSVVFKSISRINQQDLLITNNLNSYINKALVRLDLKKILNVSNCSNETARDLILYDIEFFN